MPPDEATPAPETPQPPTPVAEAPPAAAPAAQPPPAQWARMRVDLKAATERADGAEARASKFEAQIATLKASHKGEIQQLTERGDLLRHGIDDGPGMAAARAAYGEAGDERPASIGEWLDGIKGAAASEEAPVPLPRWMAPYAPQVKAPTPAPGGIKSLGAAATPPPANGAYTDEAIRALTAAGDMDALRKALASRGMKF